MPSQIAIELEEEFYRWELRGRGWFLWNSPVLPEPPFRPFFRQWTHPERNATDDGRRPTVLSGFIDWLHNRVRRRHPTPASHATEIGEPLPDDWESESESVELRMTLPIDLKVTVDLAEQCLVSLSAARHPVGFEIIGLPDSITLQFVCDSSDVEAVSRQLIAHFPESRVTALPDSLRTVWETAGTESVVAEFGLGREFMLPLSELSSFATDPLLGVLAAIADVGSGERAALQILFHPVRHPWGESIMRAVTFADGSPLFLGDRDFISGAKQKTARPLYGVVVRAAARSDDRDRCISLIRGIAAALTILDDPTGNELIPLDNDGYDAEQHEEAFLNRRSQRGGMLLNSTELISLVHLPSGAVRVPKLRPEVRASKAAPNLVLNHSCTFGMNDHAGSALSVSLSPEQRARHVQVIGASGTGKSTLLLSMIAQDLARGDGVAVLDPHGDLVDAVLRLVPPERAHDVILLDPSDDEYPIGFNVLSAHSSMEKDLLASDLVAVFHRLATSWGDQMNSVLGNAILAFLESDRGGTLVDLRRFLVEMAFRKEFLRTVRDPEVVYYWNKEFPLLTGRPQGPVLTRLDTFLRPKPIRYMVAQRQSRLDFGDILDSGKILLARLSHGVIGAENAYLLGTLLVSKLHQLALGRQRQREEDRRFFWLYIDEFHQFATPSMASILSGARKYRLGLVLAHQELQQLDKVPEVASAIASNAYTRICFRLSDQDARKLESGFAHFTAEDLQNLGTGEAICRVERAELDFNVRTTRPPDVPEDQAKRVKEEIVRLTRERFAVPRAEVEAALARSRGAVPPDEDPLASAPAEAPSPATASVAPTEEKRSPAVVLPAAPTVSPVPSPTSSGVPEPKQEIVVSESPAHDVTTPPPPEPKAGSKQKSAGRGGTQHQYLQRLIKQWAEGMGFKATIEGPVLGTRAADVALEKEGLSIACELCVTTSFVHELGNIRKCLDASFTYVAAICPEAARLTSLRTVVEQQLDEPELERVRFCTPDTFFAFVQEMQSSESPAAKTVRGYKVKTTYKQAAASDAVAKQQVSAVIAQAMRRLKRMQ